MFSLYIILYWDKLEIILKPINYKNKLYYVIFATIFCRILFKITIIDS